MATIRVGPAARPRHVDGERVAGDDLQPAGIALGDLGERGEAALVALDRHDPPRSRGKQRPGQAARSRADLDHRDAGEVAGGACDPRRQVEVEEEVLAERLDRPEAVPGNDLAQRRQSRRSALIAPLRCAVSSAASRSAAARLDGSALPLPAMSSAVPWSGEVRTKARPSVTLTVSAKESVFAGISAWS